MSVTVSKLIPKSLRLDTKKRYTRLFSAKAGNAASIKAGCVVLKKGENIGEHDTEDAEEILVVLKGKGALLIKNSKIINFGKGTALYIPPNTVHNVKNTGRSVLKYVFITSPVSFG